MIQFEKEIKSRLKTDMPKMDVRKIKIEASNVANMFTIFSYEGNKYRYNRLTKWLNFSDGSAKENLIGEFQ